MKKSFILLVVVIVLTIGFLSGCEEQPTESDISDKVTLISDVVELVNASVDFKTDQSGEINRVIVYFLYHNIAGRTIPSLQTTAKFYDENNNLVATSSPKNHSNFIEDWTEQFDPNFNKIEYLSDDAKNIDHVVLHAVEVE